MAAEALAVEALPLVVRPLWNVFTELHEGRGQGVNGPSPITWQDIDAFQRVAGISLSRWEVSMIRALDAVALQSVAKSKAAGPEPEGME